MKRKTKAVMITPVSPDDWAAAIAGSPRLLESFEAYMSRAMDSGRRGTCDLILAGKLPEAQASASWSMSCERLLAYVRGVSRQKQENEDEAD